MFGFIINCVIWTFAFYGFFEFIKTLINLYTYTNLKSDGIYLIVAVKNQENKIEMFLRSLIFKLLYSNDNYISKIIVTDLDSTDNTKKILNLLQNDYDFIKIANWKECKDIIDNVNVN